MKVIAVHSFKGGTGKTTFAANIAMILALNGFNTTLLDLDFSGPSICYLVPPLSEITSKKWINDFLEDQCTQKDFLYNYQQKFTLPAKLLVGLSNPEPKAITNILSKGRRWQMNALTKLMRLKEDLEKEGIDFIVMDTSPGLRYESINAVLLSDITFILLNIDNFDIHGTRYMVQGIYENLDKTMYIVLNKVPKRFVNDKSFMNALSEKLKSISPKIQLAGVIPCLPEVYVSLGKEIHALTKPQGTFTKILIHILSKFVNINSKRYDESELEGLSEVNGADCCV